MGVRSIAAIVALVPVLLANATGDVAAQGPLRGRLRAAIGSVPPASEPISPPGAVALPYVNLYLGGRGIVIVPSIGIGSPYGNPDLHWPQRRLAARPIIPSAAAAAFPTRGELRAMEDAELLNTAAALIDQLMVDLNRFTTADTWHNYFRLPPDALPPPDEEGRVRIGVRSLVDSLGRYETVVANPEYIQISSLPSFASSHAAVEELVRRFGNGQSLAGGAPPPRPQPPVTQEQQPQSVEMQYLQGSAARTVIAAAESDANSEVSEQLPTPPPALIAPRNKSDGEHSVLAD